VRRVRIRAENQLTRQNDRFFAQNLVTDAAPNFKEIRDALRIDKLAHLGVILRVLGRRRRHGVIECDREPFRIFNPLDAERAKDLRNRRGVIMRQHNVRLRIDDLPGDDLFQPRRACERFFGKRFSHWLIRHS
jgi:hypothetical protein